MPEVSSRPTFDDYELLDVLGGGGMATVWRARKRGAVGREVALKVLHAHLRRDARAVERFLREARIGSRVRHTNVVPVLEVVRSRDTIALAVELVDGGSIASLMRHRPPPPRVVFRLLDDLLRGLAALHALEDDGEALNVVHRDVSPENVLVGRDGVARLADFGIARAGADTKLTATGSVHGKLPYVAPEQALGHAVDARADVWAAGVVAYELVTARPFLPLELDVSAALRALVEGRYPRVEASAPAAIAEAIDRALELDPERRWPDADTFRRRLLAAAELEDEGLADAVEVTAWVAAARWEWDRVARTERPSTQEQSDSEQRGSPKSGSEQSDAEHRDLAQLASDQPDSERRDLEPRDSEPHDLALASHQSRLAPSPRSARVTGARAPWVLAVTIAVMVAVAIGAAFHGSTSDPRDAAPPISVSPVRPTSTPAPITSPSTVTLAPPTEPAPGHAEDAVAVPARPLAESASALPPTTKRSRPARTALPSADTVTAVETSAPPSPLAGNPYERR